MAPTQKIKRDMILESGYQLVKECGIECVNSRNIAKRLNCSTQPVFSQFSGMEELRSSVHEYACNKFEKEILQHESENSYFQKGYLKVIQLAREEKNIFRLIYLSEYCEENDFLLSRMHFNSNQIISKELCEQYQLNERESKDIMERISLFVQGIATVIATANISYSDEKIAIMVQNTIEDMVQGEKERGNKI